MAGRHHTHDAIVFDTTVVGGIFAQSLDVNESVTSPNTDGQVDPIMAAIQESDCRARFSSFAAATVLASVGPLNGLLLSGAGLTFYYRPFGAGAVPTATDSTRCIMATGLVLPRRMSASQGAPLSVDFEAIGYNTSGNVPIALASSSTGLLTPTEGSEQFTIGPVAFNGGSAQESLKSVAIDFGIQEEILLCDGKLYAKNVGIRRRQAVVMIELTDDTLAQTYGPGGTALTQLDMYFRRKATAGGGNQADASAVHLKVGINVAQGRLVSLGGGRMVFAAEVFKNSVGGTAPVIVTPNSAIS